ncbi:MAG: hypothetical protein IJ111_11485 [Eggerthellaceae bacterium]|nr:hypothetical protein [Eggerthellaceae bacterium]
MILSAFETLYDRTPPAWVRKRETAELMDVFAQAFEVEPPNVRLLSADEALSSFREFTAACMEAALADDALALRYRQRLGTGACELGRKVRRMLAVRSSNAFAVARFFYRGIGIELSGEIPGRLRFGPCSFSVRYTPQSCWFMSAFDEGFMRGLSGCEGADLSFSCRLTEGSPFCLATFEGKGDVS